MKKKGRINRYGLTAVICISILFSSYLIFATLQGAFLSPLTDQNFSQVMLLNVSFYNSSGNLTTGAGLSMAAKGWINATFYYNVSGSWVRMGAQGNSSQCAASGLGDGLLTNDSYCWGIISVSTLTEGIFSINATIQNGSKNVSVPVAARVMVDYTAPQVSLSSMKGVNYSNLTYTSGFIVLNATVTDNVAGVKNVTFILYNGSGLHQGNWTGIREASTNRWSNSTTFNISLLKEGYYNITVYASDNANMTDNDIDTFNNLNSSVTAVIYLDSSVPNVNSTNFSSPIPTDVGKNYSQILIINVSAVDRGLQKAGSNQNSSGINTVVFNISNSTEGQNGSLVTATREGTTNWWSAEINTSHYNNDIFNITAIVTDNAGNINGTAMIKRIRFDNIAPALSFSCTPSTPQQGNTITCTCTATDAGAGINASFGTSGYSFTAHPSTSQSGPATTTCGSQDLAGNVVNAVFAYTVEGSSGTTSGGSSGTSITPSATTAQTITASPSAPATITIARPTDYGVSQIIVETTETASNIEVSMEKYNKRPAEISVVKSGDVYRYLQITLNNVGDKLKEATVKIQVAKSWANTQNLAKEDIAMFKFLESAGAWKEVPTTYLSEDASNYYYNVALKSFSFFAIGEKTGQEGMLGAADTNANADANVATDGAGATAGEEISSKIWLIVGIVLIVIIVAAIVYMRYSKKKSFY